MACALRAIVGDAHVVTHEHQLATYASDRPAPVRGPPGTVVLLGSAREVREVIRACQGAGAPFVARGARSGLSGGALPVADGVVIALSRMRRILDLDLPNQRVVVEPGSRISKCPQPRVDPLLPAGSLQSGCLHDRPQRGGELRRRALPPAPCPVLDAPAAVRERIEVWDTAVDPGALELMRRVKKRFDPGGVCNRRLPAGV